MEDWRHHSPHLRLQHRRDGQDVNEGFGRHLNEGEGKLQFRSSLFFWKRGQQGQKLSRILWRGTGRHGQSTVKPRHGRRLNRFQVLEGTPCIASN